MALFERDDSLEDKARDRFHEEKGRWEERWDNFRESISQRLDETDRPLDDTVEYDEASDEHKTL